MAEVEIKKTDPNELPPEKRARFARLDVAGTLTVLRRAAQLQDL